MPAEPALRRHHRSGPAQRTHHHQPVVTAPHAARRDQDPDPWCKTSFPRRTLDRTRRHEIVTEDRMRFTHVFVPVFVAAVVAACTSQPAAPPSTTPVATTSPV